MTIPEPWNDKNKCFIYRELINDEEVEPMEGILHHEEGIELMPSNIELSGLEVSLVNVMSRERIMQEYINIVKEYYDYIPSANTCP